MAGASRDDFEGLLNWLSRLGVLDAQNRDLIEDALFAVENGSQYRAERDLRTAAYNFRKAGQSEAAKAVERLL